MSAPVLQTVLVAGILALLVGTSAFLHLSVPAQTTIDFDAINATGGPTAVGDWAILTAWEIPQKRKNAA